MGVKEPPTIEKIYGDGLTLKLRSNERILEITGDGCSITMTKNHGIVKIVGDGCRLRIDQNMGEVEYIGDGGQIILGSKSIRDKVAYIGDGGRIVFDDETRTKGRKHEETSREKATSRTSEGSKDAAVDKGDEVIESTAEEETGNALNARKEAETVDSIRKGEKKKERVVRIVTTIKCNEKLVGKWLVNPETTVRSFDGASFVRIVPKRSKTRIDVQ